MMVEIFVFCGWRFSNQFDRVSETHLSMFIKVKSSGCLKLR